MKNYMTAGKGKETEGQDDQETLCLEMGKRKSRHMPVFK